MNNITKNRSGTRRLKQNVILLMLIVALSFTTALPVSAAEVSRASTVTVTQYAVPLQSISLTKTSLNLNQGQRETLGVMMYPSNTTVDRTIGWTTSNPAVATVSNGVVTAVKAGTATITASCYGKTATCKVTVTGVALQSISLSKTSVSLSPNQNTTLSVTYNPTNTTVSKTVSWTSSNSAVATVSNGKITAVKAGTATITASCNGKTATCKVTVTAATSTAIPLQSISLTKTSLTLKQGQKETLGLMMNPSNTTVDRTAFWMSSNTDIATASKGVITALKPGTATIVASCNGKTATCKVTVTAATSTAVPVQSISLSKTSVSMKPGDYMTLGVTYTPSNTTEGKIVRWVSTNPQFVEVENGRLHALKTGEAMISALGIGKMASCKVTVTAGASVPVPLKSITFSKTSLSLKQGQSETLGVCYDPFYTTVNKTPTWTSSNSSVATVSNGKVTGVKAGTATITASCSGKTTACKVTVSPAPVSTVALKSISLSKTSVSMKPNQYTTLSVAYNPSNTTVSKTVSWSSSNSAVAKVSGGKITAVKAGTATITASCSGKTATCKVTVNPVEKYWNVSEAYTLLNKFRTTKSNQWYWKSNNRSKQWVTGLKSLKRDATLEKVAKVRAKEQWIMYYSRGKLTHTRPNGKSCFTAYPSNLTFKAENLGWGYTSCKAVVTGADGWAETYEYYSGQGHRRNMLSKKATKVGIACYEKDGKTCWAMCLGK